MNPSGNEQDRLLEAAVRLELNIGRLYVRYHQLLPEDAAFWWRLSLEEKNHAALLKSADNLAAAAQAMPAGLLSAGLEELQELNARVEACIVATVAKPPTRVEAFRCALELERSAGEVHFQSFMEEAAADNLARVFQTLNQGDMDHARRVQAYMAEHGLD